MTSQLCNIKTHPNRPKARESILLFLPLHLPYPARSLIHRHKCSNLFHSHSHDTDSHHLFSWATVTFSANTFDTGHKVSYRHQAWQVGIQGESCHTKHGQFPSLIPSRNRFLPDWFTLLLFPTILLQ